MITKKFPTLKGSNVYRKTDNVGYSTPSGSYPFRQYNYSINTLSLRDMYENSKTLIKV
jgi:hypothetical protein